MFYGLNKEQMIIRQGINAQTFEKEIKYRYHLLFILFVFFIGNSIYGQSEVVQYVWGGRLLNHPTTNLPAKGENKISIIHMFGSIMENGMEDLLGIYGSANIQMGYERGLSNRFSAYFLTEKQNKTQELGGRYLVFSQDYNSDNPFSMAVSYSVSLDARNEKYFGDDYQFTDRFFYTGQVSLSKQTGHLFEYMIHCSFTHFNVVPAYYYSNYLGINPIMAFKLNRKKAVFASLDCPFGFSPVSGEGTYNCKPVLTLGFILKTPTHNFQIFVTDGDHISVGKEYMYHTDSFNWDNFRFGFNINVGPHSHKRR